MITLAHLHRDAINLLNLISDSARLDAELLIAHVLDIPRTRFITQPDLPVDVQKLETIQKLIQRRQQGYPVAYLLGSRHFWDIELTVTPDTLIPRPETELLVETALTLYPSANTVTLADLGTGSGAIAIAIAKARPQWRVLATDNSHPTLQVARQNADRYQLDNIRFMHSDWFACFDPQQRFDILISNPPYIRENDPHLTQGDVQYEPSYALRAGDDGLKDLRQILSQASSFLTDRGWLLLEHGYDQGDAVEDLFKFNHFHSIQQKRDLAGQPRVTMGQKIDG